MDSIAPDEAARASDRMRPRIAITIGDPNGVGPEVVLKALSDARIHRILEPVVIGAPGVLRIHAGRLGLENLHLVPVEHPGEEVREGAIKLLNVRSGEPFDVDFGAVSKAGGALAMKAVETAVDLCVEGAADAMVTAPISKEAISKAGYDYPGHTEFIAERVGAERFTMMLVSDNLRVGLVTGHIPIWDVPKHVTRDHILEKLYIIEESLREEFGVQRPKTALLGLNPHAGDGGVLGREEIESIVPAVEEARSNDCLAFGPFPADSFFGIGAYRLYDAVLAMYHDQGLVPFKTLAFESGVNFTAGLPIIRTSPDHGTAYNIAGKNEASAGSMRAALFLAVDLVRRRVGERVTTTEADAG